MPDLDPFNSWGTTLWRAFLVAVVGFVVLNIATGCLAAMGRLPS